LRHVGRVVQKKIVIDASPEDVFEAWADPDRIARWLVDAADRRAERGRVVHWTFEGFGTFPVPVLDAVPGELLVFGGEMPGRPPFLQEVLLELHRGATLLRLLNSGFEEGPRGEEEFAGIDSGWELALAALKHWIERHRHAHRTRLLVMRAADFDYARAAPLLTTVEGLRSWFGPGPPEGPVLARTNREMLIAWPRWRGVLGCKCFVQAGQRYLALDFQAWPLPHHERDPMRARLEAALNRLVVVIG